MAANRPPSLVCERKGAKWLWTGSRSPARSGERSSSTHAEPAVRVRLYANGVGATDTGRSLLLFGLVGAGDGGAVRRHILLVPQTRGATVLEARAVLMGLPTRYYLDRYNTAQAPTLLVRMARNIVQTLPSTHDAPVRQGDSTETHRLIRLAIRRYRSWWQPACGTVRRPRRTD